jgi:acetyl-CoA acetyltransferase
LANAPLRPVFKDVGSVTAGNSSSIRYSHLLDYLFPLPLSLTLFIFPEHKFKGYTSATF